MRMSHRVLKPATPTPRCYISDLSDALENTLQSMVQAVGEMMERRGEYCYRKKLDAEKKKRIKIFEQNCGRGDSKGCCSDSETAAGDGDGVGFSYR